METEIRLCLCFNDQMLSWCFNVCGFDSTRKKKKVKKNKKSQLHLHQNKGDPAMFNGSWVFIPVVVGNLLTSECALYSCSRVH